MTDQVELETAEIGKLSEQWYWNDSQYFIRAWGVLRAYVKCHNADEWKEPRPFAEKGRERAHLLAGADDDAMKQMISSAGEESAAGKGDGLERAGVVASVVDNGTEYFDREDMVIGRHRLDCAGEV